jgi:hypothetical protein
MRRSIVLSPLELVFPGRKYVPVESRRSNVAVLESAAAEVVLGRELGSVVNFLPCLQNKKNRHASNKKVHVFKPFPPTKLSYLRLVIS